ncbi:8920_t:CDS:2 [Funneliformis mosseae]|uniref:8920_t:CDS:1 n=1 Tax=Funneliformis mosseae TaxID=27381 RepID=A0A9N9CYV4_FUNMO|nr:8920_t:CDS:2 [Funneliformis mosseae]
MSLILITEYIQIDKNNILTAKVIISEFTFHQNDLDSPIEIDSTE